MNHIGNNNDFLQIFHNQEKKDFDFIVKQILYTKNSLWVIQQHNYNDSYEDLINILNNNINEMLSKFKISDIIKYIINNLNIMHHRFRNINKIITDTTFLKLFFQNIKKDILLKKITCSPELFEKQYEYFDNLCDDDTLLINNLNDLEIMNSDIYAENIIALSLKFYEKINTLSEKVIFSHNWSELDNEVNTGSYSVGYNK